MGLLRKGHSVTVYDPSRDNEAQLVGAGATWADSASATLRGDDHDVLITALPAPPHVRGVMEAGDDGKGEEVLQQLRPGTVWIDHTTTDPDEAKRLNAAAEARGVRALEAPLTGGYALLVAGMMTTLVGGDPKLMGEYEPLMRSYVETVLHMGPVGSASVVKLITNQLAAVHLQAAGEAVMMAKKAGVNLDSFFDGMRASAGNSYVFETEVPLMYNGTFDPGFFIELHCKDLRIARRVHTEPHTGIAPEDYDKVYPMNAVSEAAYKETMERYGGRVGSSYPAKLLQDKLGESMACPGFEDWTYTIDKVKSGSIGVVHKNVGRDDA